MMYNFFDVIGRLAFGLIDVDGCSIGLSAVAGFVIDKDPVAC